MESPRIWSSADIEIGEFDGDGKRIELGLGFRNWDSSPTTDFVGIEAEAVNGCLGGFEEEGFCFEADAILTAMRERLCVVEEEEEEEQSYIESGWFIVSKKAITKSPLGRTT